MPSDPVKIPSELHSHYHERAFHHCTRCGESLQDDEHPYQVSKNFQNGECVMEHALCHHCGSAMMAEFSEESKARLKQFQQEQLAWDRGLGHCAVCGRSRDEGPMTDFAMTGVCHGSDLKLALLICGACGEGARDLLSKKTRDVWRRFVDENFPGPPPGDAVPEPSDVLSLLSQPTPT